MQQWVCRPLPALGTSLPVPRIHGPRGACRGGAEASQALEAGGWGRPRQQKPRLWVGSRTLASPGCWKAPASGRSGCCRRTRRKHSSGCRYRPCSPAAPADGATSASWTPRRCPALTTHVSPGQRVTLSGLRAVPRCGAPHPTLPCSWGSSPGSRAHVLGPPHSSLHTSRGQEFACESGRFQKERLCGSLRWLSCQCIFTLVCSGGFQKRQLPRTATTVTTI